MFRHGNSNYLLVVISSSSFNNKVVFSLSNIKLCSQHPLSGYLRVNYVPSDYSILSQEI